MEATNRRNTCIAATRCGNKFHRLNRRILLKILLQQHVAQDLLIKFSCLEDELCCCEVFAATCLLSPGVLQPYMAMVDSYT